MSNTTPHNFFERQRLARSATKRLIVYFILGVLGMVTACNVAAIAALAATSAYGFESLYIPAFWQQNAWLLLGISGGVIALICIGSLFKTSSLASMGGGAVARSMGGERVDPLSPHKQYQQLVNVVEEMSIASGMPVPEIYVMEREIGINAFAAGSSPADAAIAVTQGCLNQLSRDELQGVIAHEYSHIANNDVKINTRIIGWLFGILMVAYLGQLLLRGASVAGHGMRRSREAGSVLMALFAAGITFIVVGYIGLFFGRLIKAGISRERERLADASAVQYTRSVEGLAGALKTIGGYQHGSNITHKNPENVSHMLFGAGSPSFKFNWFATHPPIEERIKTLDPHFNPTAHVNSPLDSPNKDHSRTSNNSPEDQTDKNKTDKDRADKIRDDLRHGDFGTIFGQSHFSAEAFSQLAGRINPEILLHAASVHDNLPQNLVAAAHHSTSASHLVMAFLIDGRNQSVANQQIAAVEKAFGKLFTKQVLSYCEQTQSLTNDKKLPILQIAAPSLRQQPAKTQQTLIETALQLIHADNKVDLFEFCLYELLSHYLSYEKSRQSSDQAMRTLFKCLAYIEHDANTQPNAYKLGCQQAKLAADTYSEPKDWMGELHFAMPTLATMSAMDKQQTLHGVLAVIQYDGVITRNEIDLLRLLCGIMDVPIPPL